MPCYSPLKCWRALSPTAAGKRGIVFKASEGSTAMEIPCGQCIGCRLERSRQWAVRCMHEASLYDRNCFITLTYSDQFVPPGASLDKDAFPLFMKRLRKHFNLYSVGKPGDSDYVPGIRYYMCGEYGDTYARPHYHACLFNFDFPDKELWKVSGENRLYISDVLRDLWPFGFSTIGDVTFDSAAYVARYVMKKVTGRLANEHYLSVDPDTGECFKRVPEFTTMSRRPGIGRDWLRSFRSDVYPVDEVVVRGFKSRPPRYYDSFVDDGELEAIKRRRKVKALRRKADNTAARLRVRERVAIANVNRLKREVE